MDEDLETISLGMGEASAREGYYQAGEYLAAEQDQGYQSQLGSQAPSPSEAQLRQAPEPLLRVEKALNLRYLILNLDIKSKLTEKKQNYVFQMF